MKSITCYNDIENTMFSHDRKKSRIHRNVTLEKNFGLKRN